MTFQLFIVEDIFNAVIESRAKEQTTNFQLQYVYMMSAVWYPQLPQVLNKLHTSNLGIV